jgi:flavin-dependent dehydrogenase
VSSHIDTDADVLVAGGGPVGLAAAVLARDAGLSVVVVEPRRAPVDKACGEGLMPAAVAGLARLGVTPAGRPFAGIRYVGAGRSVESAFRAGPGLGVRRTTLHAALLERAVAAGVELRTGTVAHVEQDADGVTAAGLRTSWLLAADGLHSTIRRDLGLRGEPTRARARYGLRQHFATRPWSEYVEVHWSEHAEAYVTPVSDDLVGVAFLTARDGRSFDVVLDDFPELRARLRGAPAVTRVLGAGPLRQVALAPRQGRVLLVGDAAGYVDALTGEGVAVGLATARAAVQAVSTGRPQDYPAAWRRASRRYRWSATALVAAASRPAVRRRLVPAAAALPWVFGLAVDHVA